MPYLGFEDEKIGKLRGRFSVHYTCNWDAARLVSAPVSSRYSWLIVSRNCYALSLPKFTEYNRLALSSMFLFYSLLCAFYLAGPLRHNAARPAPRTLTRLLRGSCRSRIYSSALCDSLHDLRPELNGQLEAIDLIA